MWCVSASQTCLTCKRQLLVITAYTPQPGHSDHCSLSPRARRSLRHQITKTTAARAVLEAAYLRVHAAACVTKTTAASAVLELKRQDHGQCYLIHVFNRFAHSAGPFHLGQ